MMEYYYINCLLIWSVVQRNVVMNVVGGFRVQPSKIIAHESGGSAEFKGRVLRIMHAGRSEKPTY